ncbi:MAG: cell division protein FtsZ [archaeon]|nr:cell division protein FtsZ [archaeon]
MSGGLEDLIGEEKCKELTDEKNDKLTLEELENFTADTINGFPVVNNGQVVLKSKIHNVDAENSNDKQDFELNEDSDEYLSGLLHMMKTRTLVIGIGGAGNNAISRLQETGISSAVTLAVNTDAQDLFYANSDKKMLIGKKITGGLGAGNNPDVGEASAEDDIGRIQEMVKDKNIIFITCGLGGGTGTGAAPVIAREARNAGALVVSFCTIPFKMEGESKRIKANRGLSRLAEYSDTIIPLPNENLLRLVPNLTIMKGFKIMDEILIRSVKGIVDLVSNCGLINLDFADVKSVLNKNSECTGIIGMSEISIEKMKNKKNNESDKEQIKRILRDRTIKALNNPLLNPDPSSLQSCLVSITGNLSLTLSQVNEIVSTVSDQIAPKAKLKFGAMIDPDAKSIKITIVGLGPKSHHLSLAEHQENMRKPRSMEELLA